MASPCDALARRKDWQGPDGNLKHHRVVPHLCPGGEGFVCEHGFRVSPRSCEIRELRQKEKTSFGKCNQRRSGGFSLQPFPAKARKPHGGPASGYAAQFLPLCADA